jgi:hypothetical protein
MDHPGVRVNVSASVDRTPPTIQQTTRLTIYSRTLNFEYKDAIKGREMLTQRKVI